MSWLDKSCLQLAVRRKDKIETLTFQVEQAVQCPVPPEAESCVQMQSPSVKADWVVEHRLSRLVSNSSAPLPYLLLSPTPSPPGPGPGQLPRLGHPRASYGPQAALVCPEPPLIQVLQLPADRGAVRHLLHPPGAHAHPHPAPRHVRLDSGHSRPLLPPQGLLCKHHAAEGARHRHPLLLHSQGNCFCTSRCFRGPWVRGATKG